MKLLISLFALSVMLVGPIVVAGATPVITDPGPKPVITDPGAQPVITDTSGGGLVNPLKGIDSLPELLTAILTAVVELGTIVLVLAIVYVGFKFVVAQGNEEKLKEAKGALVWTVIGGLILLGALGISKVIQETANTLGG